MYNPNKNNGGRPLSTDISDPHEMLRHKYIEKVLRTFAWTEYPSIINDIWPKKGVINEKLFDNR